MLATNYEMKALHLKWLVTEMKMIAHWNEMTAHWNEMTAYWYEMTAHWNGNVSTNLLWHPRLTVTVKKSHRESAREEKSCKSPLAFLSLCSKLLLSRGTPRGNQRGATARIATYFCWWLQHFWQFGQFLTIFGKQDCRKTRLLICGQIIL